MRRILLVVALCFALVPLAHAQELVPDKVETMKARVVEVLGSTTQTLEGMGLTQKLQTIRAEILDGSEKGTTITLENDFLELKVGDKFYLSHTTSSLDGTDYYAPVEKERIPALLLLTALFIVVVVLFGGKQGIRGLLALLASFFFIGVMLSGIMQGYSPILVSIGVASLIVLIGSYVTHGINRTTTAAVVGMIVTVIITGLLAHIAIWMTGLTGWNTDEITYLNLNSGGSLDLVGLLLGGILIGILGVLYDAAIGQAISVEELVRAAAHYTKRDLYMRALRIGREHIGALVNTLALAYAGASLPLLLLFFGSDNLNIALTINREMFSTEIVRILVGSIGLILTVPITTAVSVYLLYGRSFPSSHSHSGHSH